MSDDALFDVDKDWEGERGIWRGMPEYSQKNLQPEQTLLVHFRNLADRDAFARFVGQRLSIKTKSIWYPEATIGTAADKVFTAPKVTPRYPIYIISKGRADTRLTAKAFEWAKVPYHIVVEPQEYAAYAAVIDPSKILTLPFSNLGLGGIPARNWVWEHSIAAGAARHWIFDDNVGGFCRFQDNLKVEVDSGVLHCAIEDWVDRYENVAMAAFNYDYFAPRKQGAKIRPITLNTRCYSGILLSNAIPHRWRGRYNEDTDLSLRILKDGLCTALFNAFLMYKKPTLTMKGGNTDELYAGVNVTAAEYALHAKECGVCASCADGYDSKLIPCEAGRQILSKDGRWLMAEQLREQHPEIVTVERKWERWQHQVDYRAFERNELKMRPDAVVPDEPNSYGMTLGEMPPDDPAIHGTAPQRVPPGPTTVTHKSGLAAASALDFLAGLAQPVPAGPEPGLGKSPAPAQELSTAQLQPESEAPGQPAPDEDCWPSAEGFAVALRERGHRLLTRDGRFFISDASRLTYVDRMMVKTHRDALIAMAEEWIELRESHSPDGDGQIDSARVAQKQSDDESRGSQDSQLASRQALQSSEVQGVGSEPTGSLSLFEDRPAQILAQFLGSEPPRVDRSYVPDEPPSLDGIDEIILNFATTGLDWAGGHRPCGVTVSTLDGQLTRFLPFAFAGGNLSEEAVKEWARRELRGKRILNANTRFDVHMSREWGVDLEEQGCTFSDIQHTAALLDDNRKQFKLDVLDEDYFPNDPKAARVDETRHSEHHAAEIAERELYTARLVGRLRDAMYPELRAQELEAVQALEDDVIPAVVEMEKNGSPIDEALLEQLGRECVERHEVLMMEVSAECGFGFEHTASGWKRLIESLQLKVPDSFDEAELNGIEHPLVRKGQRAAQYASLNSKIFKAYPEHIRDGILRYDINQLRGEKGGTVSGRFSIGLVQQVPNADNHQEAFGDWGFPRRLFVPGSGQYLEADAAQIEFRLLVHYSGNAKLLQAYRDNPRMSFHREMQAMLQQHKSDMLYTHTKAYNFAAQYGARSIKLAVMMKFITEAEGDEIRAAKRWNDPRLDLIHQIEAAYKQAHPEAGALLDYASHLMKPRCDKYCNPTDKLHQQHKHRGFVKTLIGRRSRSPNGFKSYIGLNRVLQGTGADIMKKKLAELHKERRRTGFVMRITNHDAALGDATTPETLGLVDEILNRQSYDLKVPILWECGTGANWAECK